MKNILFIVPRISDGGAERVAVELFNELHKNNNVYMISFERQSERSYELVEKPIILENKFKGKILSKFNFIIRFWKTRKIKKEKRIDYSIGFSDSANIVNKLTQKNDKIISTIHTFRSKRKMMSNFKQLIYKKILNNSDVIVTPSVGVTNDIRKKFDINTETITIPNPCKMPHKELEIADKINKPLKLVSMGRLIWEKGHKYMISSVHKLRNEGYDIELTIIGDGDKKASLVNLVSELNAESYIYFKGYLENPSEELNKNDILLMTSFVEGFGNAIVEALSSGLAVISTDCDAGPREILAPKSDLLYRTDEIELAEYGILIPQNKINNNSKIIKQEHNINALNEAIKILINDKHLLEKYRKKAKIRAKDFEVEKICTLWNDQVFK